MTQMTKPTKRLVRAYLDAHTRSTEPPPAPAELRRELGWDLIPANIQPDRADQD